MKNNSDIVILVTGGTFDKIYFDANRFDAQKGRWQRRPGVALEVRV